MKFSILLLTLASFLSAFSRAQDIDMEYRQFKAGPVNYFGYGGLDVGKVRAAFPLHTGDTVSFPTLPMNQLRQAVRDAIGSPPTDLAIVCCADEQGLLIFIGLAGNTSRALANNPAPVGDAQLDPEGRKLYDQDMAALRQAMMHGVDREDDSKGYAVSAYPEMKAVNLAMRSYALDRGPELIDVLQNSRDPEQRIAAATLLGYAKRSPAQAGALSRAVSTQMKQYGTTQPELLKFLPVRPKVNR